jgi:four helix bundle protein
MALVKHYRKLQVYAQAFAAMRRIYELSQKWPQEERYALVDQVRR